MNAFIYALFDSGNPRSIQYVGKTQDLNKRYQQHLQRNDAITKEWVSQSTRRGLQIRLLVLESAKEKAAAHREHVWIALLQPPLNTNSKYLPLMPIIPDPEKWGRIKEWFGPPKGDQPPFVAISEAARYFGISRPAVQRLLVSGESFFCTKHNARFIIKDPRLWVSFESEVKHQKKRIAERLERKKKAREAESKIQ